jgi:hypothetical protein
VRPDVARSKADADRYVPDIKRVLADVFIVAAPIERDMRENTDLVVLTVAPHTVACRVRTADKFLAKYPYDVTFRALRPSGAETELAKVEAGWGDYMFYGFGRGTEVVRWVLLDLDELRRQMILEPDWYRTWSRLRQPNHDGSSAFCCLPVASPVGRRTVLRSSPGFFDAAPGPRSVRPPDDDDFDPEAYAELGDRWRT